MIALLLSIVWFKSLRFLGKSKIEFLNPKTVIAFLYQTDESKITRIMAHQTDESTLGKESSASFMHHYPSDLG